MNKDNHLQKAKYCAHVGVKGLESLYIDVFLSLFIVRVTVEHESFIVESGKPRNKNNSVQYTSKTAKLCVCVCVPVPVEPSTACWPTLHCVCPRLKAASSLTPSLFSKTVRRKGREM